MIDWDRINNYCVGDVCLESACGVCVCEGVRVRGQKKKLTVHHRNGPEWNPEMTAALHTRSNAAAPDTKEKKKCVCERLFCDSSETMLCAAQFSL